MNLKNETLQELYEHGLGQKDIRWVGCQEFCIDIDRFFQLADREYDSGYGAPEVAVDLLIVGENWWLERHEYDGSEWWEFKQLPAMPSHYTTVNSVFAQEVGWETLSEIRVNSVLMEKLEDEP